jgi:hypothetical protein
MEVRRFSATLLLALLWPNAPGQPLRIGHFTPLTLEPSGRAAKVDYDGSYGFQAMGFRPGAMVVRARGALEVIDTASLDVTERYRFLRRDICAVDFDGTDVIALVGCKTVNSTVHTLWRFSPGARRAVPVPHLDALRWPVSFAVGDGRWFVARRGGGVDVIDLHTGRVATHHPRRTLQKGEGAVDAFWLGDHRLGLNGAVVDVRTWKRRLIAPGAQRLLAVGDYVIASGPNGITIFDRSLHLYRRLAAGVDVQDLGVTNGVIYAQVGLAWDMYDLRTGRHVGTALPDSAWLLRLIPS